ncbi:SirB2 family protein [Gallaecimonas sp. GXIMD1310]|uniref:SirB2 family protein n=1 Tax=Gallaecimonas sp. GXIMD1310 TaxID=3131926 RepID=UPI0032453103
MALLYSSLKYLHVLTIVASLILLSWRFLLDWRGRDWRQRKLWTLTPRIVDSLLLLSAFGLCLLLGMFPFQTPWLTEKLLALVAYVVLAVVALQPQRRRLMRLFALLGAYGWILFAAKLAVTKMALVVG